MNTQQQQHALELQRQAFEQEKARREASSFNQVLEMSSLLASNKLGQSQMTQDPLTVALTLQKELRKSKQATIAALEKLAASEKVGCKLYEEWEKALKMLEAEQQRSQIELQMQSLQAAEEAENLKNELKKNNGRSLADFEGLRGEKEALQKKCEEARRETVNMERKISELETQLQQKEKAIKIQEEKNQELCLRISHLQNSHNEAANERTAQLEKEHAQLEKDFAQLKQKHETQMQVIQSSALALEQKNKESAPKDALIADLKQQIEKHEQQIKEQSKQTEDFRAKLENHEQASSSLESELQESRAETSKLRQELERSTKELERTGLEESGLRQKLQTAEGNFQTFQTEKTKLEATIQTKSNHIQTLANEITTLKTNLAKFSQSQRERDSYRADMEQISSVLFLIETTYPLLSTLFQEQLSGGASSLGKSSLYPDAEHNNIVTKMQILERFLKDSKSQSVSVARIQSGSAVLLYKNRNNHYQVLTNPEAEKGLYFLDPECHPAWEQSLQRGDNIMGVVYFMSDPQEAGNDNEFHLAPKTKYQTVYVQQIDPLASVNV